MTSTWMKRAAMGALGLVLGGCTARVPEENLASVALASEEDDAYVIWHSLPSEMDCGEWWTVSVEMMNYGETWQPGSHQLGAFQGPGPFEAPSAIELAGPVAYGETHEFVFGLRAPSYATEARSQWRMNGSGWFGDIAGDSPDPVIQVNCSAAADHAAVAGADFPSSVECGETFDASVTFRNDGETTWSPAEGYRLEAHPGNPIEGPPRVDVDGTVGHGESQTFQMTLTAPSTAGNFWSQWQMASDANGPFNDVFQRSIQVNCDHPEDSAAIAHTIPPSVQCGGHFSFTVTVTNTGTTTWRSYPNPGVQGYYLGLTEDSVPLGDTRYFFPPGVEIEHGESHTFTIVMHGPPTADTYYVAFQMFNRDRNDWFGPRAEQDVSSTCNWENAAVVRHGLAREVNCGEPYSISVTMKNTGLWTWDNEGEYRLKNVGSLSWPPWTPHIPLPPNTEIPPGSEHTFETVLTVPFVTGDFPHGWQMTSWTGGEWGERAFRFTRVRCDSYAARVTGVSMPTEIQCGQIIPASLTYQNRGTELWATPAGDKLGAIGGTDPFGPAEVPMPAPPYVFPGESKTFLFNMTGPYAPTGDYPSDWSMFHGTTPFGDVFARTIRLNCLPLDARLVGFRTQGRANCEPEADVLVTVRNAGYMAWGVSATDADIQPEEFSFVQGTPLSPFALVESIEFPPSFKVAPGETTTFPVRFRRAPSEAVRQTSSWQMQMERLGDGDGVDAAGPKRFGPTMRIPVPKLPRWCD